MKTDRLIFTAPGKGADARRPPCLQCRCPLRYVLAVASRETFRARFVALDVPVTVPGAPAAPPIRVVPNLICRNADLSFRRGVSVIMAATQIRFLCVKSHMALHVSALLDCSAACVFLLNRNFRPAAQLRFLTSFGIKCAMLGDRNPRDLVFKIKVIVTRFKLMNALHPELMKTSSIHKKPCQNVLVHYPSWLVIKVALNACIFKWSLVSGVAPTQRE